MIERPRLHPNHRNHPKTSNFWKWLAGIALILAVFAILIGVVKKGDHNKKGDKGHCHKHRKKPQQSGTQTAPGGTQTAPGGTQTAFGGAQTAFGGTQTAPGSALIPLQAPRPQAPRPQASRLALEAP
ncbi:hypothetical protein FPOA_07289 [Fusarium poae]|uniref:Uncharacterized protein n=1 Tax=Fusarium poae TaxID=36050 RepID=A0A1B8AK27_FUSPO|nr:hypothetical protein FPOA_07289 [Fusarium poae]